MSEEFRQKTAEIRFRAGSSAGTEATPPGNRGRRHRVTLAVEAVLDGEAEALTRKAIEMAKEGDSVALRLSGAHPPCSQGSLREPRFAEGRDGGRLRQGSRRHH